MKVTNSTNSQNWVLGVTGGIAAYKVPELTRRIKSLGHDVRVVLSAGAKEFVTPMTLQAVSGHPVCEKLFDCEFEAAMGHIELAKWADNILIAPCSANRLAALAQAFADDLLTTICLASKAPLWVAPAMNQQMWAHPGVQNNLKILRAQGAHVLGPAFGEQACKDVGWGRMLEPEAIIEHIFNFKPPSTKPTEFWGNKKVLITAGPTREFLDPVRFISNKSSGKMGYAIAQVADELGAKVHLISGPVNLPIPQDIKVTQVVSAEQMHLAVMNAQKPDIFISTAAVADYRFEEQYDQKMKKDAASTDLNLVLKQNPDILRAMSQQENKPFCVGFAAETQNFEQNALLKLQSKKCDLIALNDISQQDIGFDSDENAIQVFGQGLRKQFSKNSKYKIALQLLETIREVYDAKNST